MTRGPKLPENGGFGSLYFSDFLRTPPDQDSPQWAFDYRGSPTYLTPVLLILHAVGIIRARVDFL